VAERRGRLAWFTVALAAAVLGRADLARAQEGTKPVAPASSLVGPLAPVPLPQIETRGLGFAHPAAESHPTQKSGGAATILSTALPLAGVLSLILGAGAVIRVLAKRGGLKGALGAGGKAPSGILEVIGRYPIARGSTLVLLKVDRRLLLLSQTSTGRLGLGATFAPLTEITDPEEVGSILLKAQDAEGHSMTQRFRGMLSRYEESMEPQGRGGQRSPGADSVEVWDDRNAIPVVDVSGRGELAGVSSLRQRLAGFSSGGGGTA
jgi:hypothetical protein